MLKQGWGISGLYDNEEAEMAVRELLKTKETCTQGDGVLKILLKIDSFVNFLAEYAGK
jgi:hypothetical protein